jgi:hypothetical protein
MHAAGGRILTILTLYVFFGILSILFFLLGFYDYGFTKSKLALVPTMLSATLSLILVGLTYSLDIVDWQMDAIATFWFMVILITTVLVFAIALSRIDPRTVIK